MTKGQRQDFFREIKKSLARYLSILFIVFLGVAFFSGIRSSETAMKKTADTYLDSVNFMDIRVVSTLGLTEEDCQAIRGIRGVKEAEGMYSQDVLTDVGETQKVLGVVSVPEDVSQMYVTEGRLPLKKGECFLDDKFASANGYSVGDTIVIYSGTEDGILDLFHTDTYTIVGLGKDPFYLTYERGSSGIGNGSQAGFMAVQKSDFVTEIYSQIYVTVEGAAEYNSYSDAYTEKVDEIQEALEAIAEDRCQIRYEDVTGTAQAAIDEAESQLADSEKTLTDGWQALADGEQQLADAESQYESGLAEWQENYDALQEGKAQLASGREQLQSAENQYEEGLIQLVVLETVLKLARQTYEQEKEMYIGMSASVTLAQANTEDKICSWLEENGVQIGTDGTLSISGLDLTIPGTDLNLGEILPGSSGESSGEIPVSVTGEEVFSEDMLPGTTSAAQLSDGEEGSVAALAGAAEDTGSPAEGLIQPEEEAAGDITGAAGMDEAAPLISDEAGIGGEEELITGGPESGGGEEAWQEALAQEAAGAAGGTASEGEEVLEGEEIPEDSYGLLEVTGDLDGVLKGIEEASAGFSLGTELSLNDVFAALDQGTAQMLSTFQTYLDQQDALITKYEKQAAAARVQLNAANEQISAARTEINENEVTLQLGEAQLTSAKTELDAAPEQIAEGKQELEDSRKQLEEGQAEFDEKSADAREQLEDAKEQLAQVEYPQWYVLDRDTIQAYVEFGSDADAIENISRVFPVIFFLVAALVSLTSMTRMVEEERVLIGTMKALGYGKWAIMSKYLLYALSASLAGGITGALIGEKLFPTIIVVAYKIMYQNLVGLEVPYVPSVGLLAIGIAVGCTTIATFSSCYRELMANPASLMRPAAPKQGKRVLMEHFFFWRFLNFNMKSTIRNLMRYKKRIFMTVFGIGASMALLIVGFGLRDSLTAIIDNQYDTVWMYSAALTVDAEEDQEDLTKYLTGSSEVEDFLYVRQKSMDFETTGTPVSGTLMVISEPDRMDGFISLHDLSTKEMFSLSGEGVIITKKLSTLLGVGVGDTFYLKVSDTTAYPVTVTAIAEHYLQHYVYMTPELYETLFGQAAEWNEILLDFTQEGLEKEEEISGDLLSMDAVTGVQLTSGLSLQIRNMLHSLDLVIIVLIISAGMLAYVVLYNLNNINIAERRRELATLKVLGFYDMEVAMYVYRENVILTLFGIGAGVGLGIALHRYLILTVEVEAMYFGRQIHLESFLFSAAITAVFAVIVNISMYYKLKKIDMVESLKSVE